MGKPFTEEEKNIIRSEIIAVARDLFAKKTFKDVKISEITRAVGVSKGSFYSFFDSKESLLVKVMIEVEKDIHQEIISSIEGLESSREMLKKILITSLKKLKENQLLQSLLTGENISQFSSSISKKEEASLLEIDQNLILNIIGDKRKLKVDIDLAVDLMRSIFFLQTFASQIQTDIDEFNEVMVDVLLERIFE